MADSRPAQAEPPTERAAGLPAPRRRAPRRGLPPRPRDPARRDRRPGRHPGRVRAGLAELVGAPRPVPVRAVVRPDPRQHVSRPAAVNAPTANDRHLGRGCHHRRRPVRTGARPRRPGQRDRGAVARPPGRRRAPLLPRPAGRARSPAGSASRPAPSSPAFTTPSSTPRRHRHRRRQGNHPMTDDQLELRLRDWYRAEVPADETAPARPAGEPDDDPSRIGASEAQLRLSPRARPACRGSPAGGRDRGRWR